MARGTRASYEGGTLTSTIQMLRRILATLTTLASGKNPDASDYTLPIGTDLTLDPTNLALDASVLATNALLPPVSPVHTVTNSADMSTAANVTGSPTAGQKLVIHDLVISVGTTMNVVLKEETSNTVIFGPYYMLANTSLVLSRNRLAKLATADKKLKATASVSGNITVETWCSSEA